MIIYKYKKGRNPFKRNMPARKPDFRQEKILHGADGALFFINAAKIALFSMTCKFISKSPLSYFLIISILLTFASDNRRPTGADRLPDAS